MLTDEQIQDALARFSYKPGWDIIYYMGAHEGPHIAVLATVENSYSPGEFVELDIHSPISPVDTEAQFYDWLLWRLKRIETHECMEWFKVDGKPWIDPHRPGADQDR